MQKRWLPGLLILQTIKAGKVWLLLPIYRVMNLDII